MPLHDIDDWKAVIEAERLQRRIDFQDDLRYARGLQKGEVHQANEHRKFMDATIKRLMIYDEMAAIRENRKRFKQNMMR